jgi:hypothetical protein
VRPWTGWNTWSSPWKKKKKHPFFRGNPGIGYTGCPRDARIFLKLFITDSQRKSDRIPLLCKSPYTWICHEFIRKNVRVCGPPWARVWGKSLKHKKNRQADVRILLAG